MIATVLTCLAGTLLLPSCGSLLPWHNEPVGEEVNLVFTLEKNVVVLPSATIDGRAGRFLFGSAEPRTLDYRSGVLTYQREGIHPELMTIYPFGDEPMVTVLIDGQSIAAVVDTASPDTLILPRGNDKAERRNAHVQVANTDFGMIDVRLANVSTPRIGNRILSKFLVTIDYGKRRVGLWRDPRISLSAS